MRNVALVMLLGVLSFAGEARATQPWGTNLLGGDPQLLNVQYRRGPRCFLQTREVRFIDRFGRPRVRVVQRRVCR